jgi:hypothetical protein
MALRSPVKYKENGKYLLEEKIELSAQDEQAARTRGLEDAKNPFDVLQNKATLYERDLQHTWGKELVERIGHNIIRVRQWGDLIRSELQDLILAKGEFQERLQLRKHKLSDSQLGIFPYVIILVLITLLEMPINVTVFNIFGENLLFTYLLAGILSIVLSLLAHFVGGWIKAEGFKTRSLLLIFLVIVLLGILAWVRLRFFSVADESPLKAYFQTGIEMNVIVGMFFIINSLLFIMAIVASHHHHDSDPLFVKAKKSYSYFYKKVSNLLCACEGEMLNMQMCIPRCQECFKKNRLIYINAYKSSGALEPLCFKDSITIETARITDLDERLKTIEEEYNQLRSKVQACLEAVGGCENKNGL